MKQVISGYLKETPNVRKEQNKMTGDIIAVTKFTLLAEDEAAPEITVNGVQQKKRIPLTCMAYGDLAKEIGELQKEDCLTASTIMRYGENRHGGYPVYVIKRIDGYNDLQRQMDHLLTGYEEGQYDQVFEREVQPEFTRRGLERDRLNNRSRDAPAKEKELEHK